MSLSKIFVNDTEVVSVDNELTANSENLIKSGATTDSLSSLSKAIPLIGSILAKPDNLENLNLKTIHNYPMFARYNKPGFVSGILASISSDTDVDIIKIDADTKEYTVIKTVPSSECKGYWKFYSFGETLNLELGYEIGISKGVLYGERPLYSVKVYFVMSDGSWNYRESISASIIYCSPSISSFDTKSFSQLGGIEFDILDYNKNVLSKMLFGFQYINAVGTSGSPIPEIVDYNTYYTPLQTGVYENFGNIEVDKGEFSIIAVPAKTRSYLKVVLYSERQHSLSLQIALTLYANSFITKNKANYNISRTDNNIIFHIDRVVCYYYRAITANERKLTPFTLESGTFNILNNPEYYFYEEDVWDDTSDSPTSYVIYYSSKPLLVSYSNLTKFTIDGGYLRVVPVCSVFISTNECYIIEEYLKRNFADTINDGINNSIPLLNKKAIDTFSKNYVTNQRGKYNLYVDNGTVYLTVDSTLASYISGGALMNYTLPAGTFNLLTASYYVDDESVWDGVSTKVYDIRYGNRGPKLFTIPQAMDLSNPAVLGTVPLCRALFTSNGCYIIDEYLSRTYPEDIVAIDDISTKENSFSDRETLITDSYEVLPGLLTEYGTISESNTFKHTSMIEIPSGVEYILFDNNGSGYCPSYVFCYSTDEFTASACLGRSDSKSYQSLTMVEANFNTAFKLQNGTRYISFFGGNSNFTVSDSIEIYGSDRKSYCLIIKNDKIIELLKDGSAFYGEPNTTDHFTVKVNCHSILQNTSNPVTLEDELQLYDDYAMIMLPSTYTKTGAPVPLVIGCHGAGGDVSVQDSQTERSVLYLYLVANGYAVCDCNGFPEQWCQLVGVSKINNIGSPIAMECYIKTYQYIIDHYNVQHKVLISGGSMGGISSTNLVLSGAIPVAAQGINCPVLDAYNQIFLRPWSGGLPKTAMGVVYEFTKDANNNYIYDEEKLRGFNPMTNNMQSYNTNGERVSSVGNYNFTSKKLNGEDVIEYKYHPCPLKIWHCEDDGTVNYACSERLVKAIRNAGGNAVLRSIVTGGHGPLNVGEPLENPSGNINYRGTTLVIKPIIEEIYMFFERYAQKL